MSEFNPYLKWLGIRETTRPINHYRLLGLELFESDPEVISMAADRQMSHIRTYQNGPQGDLSQQLLNELARARRCLLSPEQKQQYDRQLRGQETAAAIPVAAVKAAPVRSGPAPSPAGLDVKVKADPSARQRNLRRARKQMVWSVFGWIGGGLLAVGLAAVLIQTGILPTGGADQKLADLTPGPGVDDPDPSTRTDPQTASDPAADSDPGSSPGEPNTNPDADERPDSTNIDTPPTIAAPENSSSATVDLTEPAMPVHGPILPEAGEWTLGNSSEYPPPSSEFQGLLSSIGRDIEQQRWSRSTLSNPTDTQRPMEELPTAAQCLIGFRVHVDSELNISQIQPIYQRENGVVAGTAMGPSTRHHVDLIAKPGFAVASVTISVVYPVRSFQVEFLPVDQNGFVEDAIGYSSPLIGQRVGPVQTISPVNGMPPAGVFGGVDQQLVSIGLASTGSRSESLASGTGDLPMQDPFAVDLDDTVRPGDSPSEADPPGTPVPNLARYGQILAEINQQFRSEINSIERSHQPSDYDRLANRLYNAVRNPDVDADKRYVLLELAAKNFALAGRAPRAVEALSIIEEEYEIEYWTMVQEALNVTAVNLKPNDALEFKTTVDTLIETAVQQQEFEAAFNLIDGAQRLSGGFQQLKNWYRQRRENVKEYQDLLEDQPAAVEAIATDPADGRAHQAMGDYYFVVQRDLEQALHHWAQSGENSLARLAQLEANVDRDDGDAMLELCEAWQRLGRGTRRTLKRYYAAQRAYELYGETLDLLDESDREKAEKEIVELNTWING